MSAPTTTVLVIESGDRLTRAEFHRRYCARPDVWAELVEGVVYVASPVRVLHGKPHALMMGWLTAYWAKHPELTVIDNTTTILDNKNEVQADAALYREEAEGAHVNEGGYVEGAPQLMVEVAASSASYDLHDKMEAYRRNGVREYIVWRIMDGMIDWFRLKEGQYVWVEPDSDGIIESEHFAGLRLSVPKMLAGDLAGVLTDLNLGD